MIQLREASFAYSARTILDAASLRVPPGGRVGLLGRNGAGKTTLFKLLRGELSLDSGEVAGPRPRGVAYLAQHPDLPERETILEHVLASHPTLWALERRILELERRMEEAGDPGRLDRLVEQHRTLSREFEAEGGYAIEAKVSRILEGLGVARGDFLKRLGVLSPGEKNRVALAKVLLSRADLILLDEPTNHLDLDMVEWLEGFLAAPVVEGIEAAPTVLIASHDRYFLNVVATHIVELRSAKLHLYEGNYDDFARQRAEEIERQEKLHRQQAAEVEKELEFIRRNFAGQKARQAKSREKKLARITAVARPEAQQAGPRLRFRDIERAGNDVLEAIDLDCGYGEEVLVRGACFELERGDRVAILGANGCGKTTLLRTLLGDLPPLGGAIERGVRTRLGHYAQDVSRLGSGKSLFDDLHDAVPTWTNQEVLDHLAAFLFRGDDVRQPLSSLSGGEKARYALLRLLLSGANCLFLDEPTNHLDIYARAALEECLLEFPETVVFVSHDRYFIDRVADRILLIEEGRLQETAGSYEEHRAARRAARVAAAPREASAARPTAERARGPAQERRSAQEAARREERLVREIARIEARIEEARAACGVEENYRDADAMRRLKEELRGLDEALARLYQRWEAGDF